MLRQILKIIKIQKKIKNNFKKIKIKNNKINFFNKIKIFILKKLINCNRILLILILKIKTFNLKTKTKYIIIKSKIVYQSPNKFDYLKVANYLK